MTNSKILDDHSLDVLFRDARSHNTWQDYDVADVLIRAVYDLMKFGPTEANSCPARFVFVKSAEAKARLKPHLDAGNVNKVMTAPVTVIIGSDLKFYDQLPKLFPHTDARSWFAGNDEKIQKVAFRNSSLQGAYLMMAARSLGLDCGPMGGFNAEGVNAEFFPEGDVKANFICAIGHGDPSGIFGRSPRLSFEEACEIL